jgi:predicted negative regulator of RcsB-dependent stress response
MGSLPRSVRPPDRTPVETTTETGVSDTLTEEELIERIRTWWQENGTALLVGLVVVIAGVVGWRWYDSSRAEAQERASMLYDSFMGAEGEAREELAKRIDAEIPGTSYQVLSLLQRARTAHDGGDLAAAETDLREALEAASHPVLADLVRLRLARVVEQLGRPDEAFELVAAVKSKGYRTHALELKGDLHMLRAERTLAHEAYREALDALAEGSPRPVLEMKVADTADAGSANAGPADAGPADAGPADAGND